MVILDTSEQGKACIGAIPPFSAKEAFKYISNRLKNVPSN